MEDLKQKPEQGNQNKLETLWTRKEVADYFKISLVTLYLWTKDGKIDSVGVGRRVYYRHSDVEKAIINLK